MGHALYVLGIGAVLAIPMVVAIEAGFVFARAFETRRILYAIAAIWYLVFLVLFWRASPVAAWVYAIPQGLVAIIYGVTKFRAAPSRRH